ncbi:MAG: zinc ribbon domain-containing protein [Leptospiraceae bacterium]|nr:zinc ribbon domain-containing protein [Leptospiraceae bacterium]
MAIICTNCNSENPDDFNYCKKCGNVLVSSNKIGNKNSWMDKIPSWAYIFIFIGGIGLVIGSFILFTVGIAYLEGFASLIFIVLGFLILAPLVGKNSNNLMKGGAIAFFSLMGMAIDQTGNYIYNKPIEIIYCEKDEKISRTVDVSHSFPGRTDMTQDFKCVNKENQVQYRIPILPIIGIRFLEYIILAYFLIWVRKFYDTRKKKSHE